MLEDVTPGGGLYIIWLSDTHFYGGRAKNFRGRWARHRRDLEKGRHRNPKMQAVFNLHGHFEAKILLATDGPEEQRSTEQTWLDRHFGQEGCLNLSAFADGGQGPHTEESKAKLRGRVPSAETRALWSFQRKGRKRSPSAVAKQAETQRGRKMPEGTRASISITQQGREFTEEHRAKLKAVWAEKRKEKSDPRFGPRKP